MDKNASDEVLAMGRDRNACSDQRPALSPTNWQRRSTPQFDAESPAGRSVRRKHAVLEQLGVGGKRTVPCPLRVGRCRELIRRNPFAFVQEKPALQGFIGFKVVPVLR